MKPLLKIDGVLTEFTDYYPIDECFGGVSIGNAWGSDEDTQGSIRSFNPSMSIAFVNVFRRNPDGSIWGIKAAFDVGKWEIGENDQPLFSVSDRLA